MYIIQNSTFLLGDVGDLGEPGRRVGTQTLGSGLGHLSSPNQLPSTYLSFRIQEELFLRLMASVVRFKFKSGVQFETIQFDGVFISVGELKKLIAEKKNLSIDASAELVLEDPLKKTEYTDPSVNIVKNTSVIVRRVPLVKSKILQQTQAPPRPVAAQAVPIASRPAAEDDFGRPTYSEKPVEPAVASGAEDEEAKIQKSLAAAQNNWASQQEAGGVGRGRGRGRGPGGFAPSRFGTFEPRPERQDDRVCFRCQKPGHQVKDCPTNGDPAFDVRRLVRPAGIPQNLLQGTSEGSYLMPDGGFARLMPNEDRFNREMAGMPNLEDVAQPRGAAQRPPGPGQAAKQLPGGDGAEEPGPLLLDNKPHVEASQPPTSSSVQVPELAGGDEGGFSGGAGLDLAESKPAGKASPSPSGRMEVYQPTDEEVQPRRRPAAAPSPEPLPPFPKGLLPLGPVEFVLKAFQRDEALSEAEFEELKAKALEQLALLKPSSRGGSRGRSPAAKPSSGRGHRSRSQSRPRESAPAARKPSARASSPSGGKASRRSRSRDKGKHRSGHRSRSRSRSRSGSRHRTGRHGGSSPRREGGSRRYEHKARSRSATPARRDRRKSDRKDSKVAVKEEPRSAPAETKKKVGLGLVVLVHLFDHIFLLCELGLGLLVLWISFHSSPHRGSV